MLFLLLALACSLMSVRPVHAETDQTALFTIHVVKKGDTLWKIADEHWETVAKINRISPECLRVGMKLKVPYDWEMAEQNAHVPRELPGVEGKFILADLNAQAFGAYDEHGVLILWGPISSASGRVECGRQNEKKRECVTPAGDFRVIEKKKHDFSKDYPPPHGGAPMPYSQRFYGAYKIHAGKLPGYPDSHGCIRVLLHDAQWLFSWTNEKTRIIVIKGPLV